MAFVTALNRRAHILWWRCSNRTSEYMRLQIKTNRYTRESEIAQKNINSSLKSLFELLPHKNARILDAGCGDGWTMDQIKNAGYLNIYGVDLNRNKLAIAKKYGHSVFCVMLPHLSCMKNSFDFIFCRHVYEHLLFPQQTLLSFRRALGKDGILFLITPESKIDGHSSESHVVSIKGKRQVKNEIADAGFKILNTRINYLEDKEFWIVAKKD